LIFIVYQYILKGFSNPFLKIKQPLLEAFLKGLSKGLLKGSLYVYVYDYVYAYDYDYVKEAKHFEFFFVY